MKTEDLKTKQSQADSNLDDFLTSVLEEEKKEFKEGLQTFSQHADALSHKIYDAINAFQKSYESGFQAYREYVQAHKDKTNPPISEAPKAENPELFLEAVEDGAPVWMLLGFSFETLIQFYEQLTALFDKKEYRRVKDGFTFLTTVAQDMALFWTGLGIVLTRLEEYDVAHEAYDMALKLDPSFSDAYIGALHSYVKQKQFQKAVNLCDEGLAYCAASNDAPWKNDLHSILNEAKSLLTPQGVTSKND